jgi:hypothetical protein
MISKFSLAQVWDKFIYYSETDKFYYDIDEGSLKHENEKITFWVRARPKEENTNYFANLDKLNFKCTTKQYSFSIRRRVDKMGKVINTLYDVSDDKLDWLASPDKSIIMNLGNKFCNKNGSATNQLTLDEKWLSLGKSENSEFTFYINPTMNKTSNDELTYISRIIFDNEQKTKLGKAYNYIQQETVINCRESTFFTTRSDLFDKNNNLVDSSFTSKDFGVFQTYKKESYVGRVKEKYCITSNSVIKNNDDIFFKQQSIRDDEAICEKFGFKKGTLPFERCIKQLGDAR